REAMKSNSYYRVVRRNAAGPSMIRIFRPFLSGGVPEYKHVKSEIAILRKTPAQLSKVPRGMCISRVYGWRLRFLFVCHFCADTFMHGWMANTQRKAVDRSVRQCFPGMRGGRRSARAAWRNSAEGFVRRGRAHGGAWKRNLDAGR